jgi:hypothetical protein
MGIKNSELVADFESIKKMQKTHAKKYQQKSDILSLLCEKVFRL